ncbi:MAG TPA: HAMP domain-containing sensor histidine kinase [Spirosoma sp.]|nr:HAMP domain-containing sensor histidine kinase [Spirosoma sp.]
MTIRDHLTIRFTALVSSILLLTFVSIYAFCWYFITSDFYRRLDRKAATMGDMLIRHRLDADLIAGLSRIRRDQLPNQKVMAFDGHDSLILQTNQALPLTIPTSVLSDIRQRKQKDFRQDGYYLSGSRFMTATGQFVVIASAENIYGDEFLRQLLWALAGLFGLAIGITTLAGRLFAGDSLKPMQQIEQTLSHIFPGNQNERLPVRAEPDEISRLSNTINRLLDRVAESFRLQRMFVANVSHELKNPLTQISSQLEVSLLNQRQAETYRQTIRSVLEDVGQLSALTHELLQLSQASQEGRVELLSDAVRLDELVWDVRDEVIGMNPRYQVTVELVNLPDDADELALPGNKTLLCTALKNLTENACKFASDGQAHLRVHFDQHQLQIDIENNGQPIGEADLPYLFEPFYRSRQRAHQVSGYGVGLALVDQIVRLHGGEVQVQSEVGTRTRFSIALPR